VYRQLGKKPVDVSVYLFIISTYEIWKVLISLAKKFFFIANFHVLGLFIPKKRV
jgi:hypothetical protein